MGQDNQSLAWHSVLEDQLQGLDPKEYFEELIEAIEQTGDRKGHCNID